MIIIIIFFFFFLKFCPLLDFEIKIKNKLHSKIESDEVFSILFFFFW